MDRISSAQPSPKTPSYRKIKLSQGKYAIVDPEDYEWLSNFPWHAEWNQHTQSFYAKRSQYIPLPGGGHKVLTIRMHREVLGLKPGDPIADHIKRRNTLDNRHSNLRVANTSQSTSHRGKTRRNTSGFKGVSWHKRIEKWSATIMANKKMKHLGYFANKRKAYKAYCAAAKNLHGEFAALK
jgi:hypothetical protein